MAAETERWVGLEVGFSEGSRVVLKWVADNLLCTGNKLLLLHVLKDPDNETPTNRRFQGFQEHCGTIQMNTDARSNKVVSITVLATHIFSMLTKRRISGK
ncbi:hypothetical protein ACQ4PT_021851 [Festuca glaucescens]